MLYTWCHLFCMHVQGHMCGWMHVQTRSQPDLILRTHSPCSCCQLRYLFCHGEWFHMKMIYKVSIHSKRMGKGVIIANEVATGEFRMFQRMVSHPCPRRVLATQSGSQSKKQIKVKTWQWDGDLLEDRQMLEVKGEKEKAEGVMWPWGIISAQVVREEISKKYIVS